MMPEYVVSPHKILATHAFFGTLHVRNVEFAVGLDAKRKGKKGKKTRGSQGRAALQKALQKVMAEPASINLTSLY